MPRPITAVAEPVQFHAEGLEIDDGGGLHRIPAQQADGGETETLARRRQGVKMIGMRAAQADQAFGACLPGRRQMLGKLEPLVAADQRIDQVEAQYGDLDPGLAQPVQVQWFEGGVGVPVGRGEHCAEVRRGEAGSLTVQVLWCFQDPETESLNTPRNL